jgi:hypothetical protein
LSTPKAEGVDAEPPDPNARILTRKKSNAARRDETIGMRWQDGVFVVGQAPTGIFRTVENSVADRVFLSLLDKRVAEDRPLSHKPRASNYAPTTFAAMAEREGLRKPDFTAAMERLFSRKQIKVDVYVGADRHKAECIIRCEES